MINICGIELGVHAIDLVIIINMIITCIAITGANELLRSKLKEEHRVPSKTLRMMVGVIMCIPFIVVYAALYTMVRQ